mmetsp:Transcript_5948/g.12442  ORF Transcript_5948/g.12442 Transcript_5948/m.12442 type:complete len:236 (+) Transcript_5948:1890-2597(+)
MLRSACRNSCGSGLLTGCTWRSSRRRSPCRPSCGRTSGPRRRLLRWRRPEKQRGKQRWRIDWSWPRRRWRSKLPRLKGISRSWKACRLSWLKLRLSWTRCEAKPSWLPRAWRPSPRSERRWKPKCSRSQQKRRPPRRPRRRGGRSSRVSSRRRRPGPTRQPPRRRTAMGRRRRRWPPWSSAPLRPKLQHKSIKRSVKRWRRKWPRCARRPGIVKGKRRLPMPAQRRLDYSSSRRS